MNIHFNCPIDTFHTHAVGEDDDGDDTIADEELRQRVIGILLALSSGKETGTGFSDANYSVMLKGFRALGGDVFEALPDTFEKVNVDAMQQVHAAAAAICAGTCL